MITFEKTNRLTDIAITGNLLTGLENFYPNFNYWYTNNCIPGIIVGSDSLIVAKDNGVIIGAALGKSNKKETKLRCVRVRPEYKNKGTGLRLIEHILKDMNRDKPHCTVSEEMINEYSRAFINYFNFELSEVNKGMYRGGKLEYIFNSASSKFNK